MPARYDLQEFRYGKNVETLEVLADIVEQLDTLVLNVTCLLHDDKPLADRSLWALSSEASDALTLLHAALKAKVAE